MPKIVTDDRARQGGRGRPVLLVLVGSLFLLGIYMVSLLVWSGSESPDQPSQNAARQTATGSPSGSTTTKNPTDRISPANPAYPTPTDPSASGTARPPAR